MTVIARKPTPGERLYVEWCDAPGSDRERYWFAMNRADKAAWEKLGAFVDNLRGVVDERDSALRSLESANQTIEWLAEQNERFRAELNLPAGGQ